MGASRGRLRISRLRVGSEELVILSVPSALDRIIAHLTPAERNVARLIAEGKTNRQIAKIRGTSARTVANQAASLFRKLGVRGRADLAKLLVESND